MTSLSKTELRERLFQLRSRVAVHFERAVERSPGEFRCGEGCDRCCHSRFGVFELEAAPIRGALAELADADPALRSRIRRQADDPTHADRCALLVDRRCSVYDHRPLICRSQGLPLLVEDRVDWCPLNFSTQSPPTASVLSLDALNAPLAALARAWADGGARVELDALAREP